MTSPRSLAGRTILMSGGSRGIGLAIALRAARDNANIVLLAKTDQPDPRLPGTVHTAVAEIEQAGGRGLVGGRSHLECYLSTAVHQARRNADDANARWESLLEIHKDPGPREAALVDQRV